MLRRDVREHISAECGAGLNQALARLEAESGAVRGDTCPAADPEGRREDAALDGRADENDRRAALTDGVEDEICRERVKACSICRSGIEKEPPDSVASELLCQVFFGERAGRDGVHFRFRVFLRQFNSFCE